MTFEEALKLMNLLAELGGYFGDEDVWKHGQRCKEGAEIMKREAMRLVLIPSEPSA